MLNPMKKSILIFALILRGLNCSAQCWDQISTFSTHSLGKKSDGSLWSWGKNSSGQLGIGTNFGPVSSPIRVGDETEWKTIKTGESHSFGIKSNGTLWAWGENGCVQLGDGSSASRLVPVQVGVATKWAILAAGFYHSLGIDSSGTMWAWGCNGWGAISGGNSLSSSNVPMKIGTANAWKSIAAGAWHSHA